MQILSNRAHFNENARMQEIALILRARASEHQCNVCEQFKQKPNFASTFKLNGTIRYPCVCQVAKVFITALNSAFVSVVFTFLIWAVACRTAVFYVLSYGLVIFIPLIHFHCNTHFIVSFRAPLNCAVLVAVFPRRCNITCIALQAFFLVCLCRWRKKIVLSEFYILWPSS